MYLRHSPTGVPSKVEKITVVVHAETVEALDKIADDELTGSRGRAIDLLARRWTKQP